MYNVRVQATINMYELFTPSLVTSLSKVTQLKKLSFAESGPS